MKNLFAYDGLLATGARYIWKLLILNVLYVLTCIPVFTIGAATSAMYAMFLNAHEQGGNIANYFREFGGNFRKATPLWLWYLLIGGVLAFNLYALATWTLPMAAVLRVVMIVLSVVYFLCLAFVFPLQAKFENTRRMTAKNAMILGITAPVKAMVMTALNVLPWLALAVDGKLFARIMSVWLLVGFSLVIQINALLAQKVFARFMPAQDEAEC